MSTKTTIKRIALVAVSALGLGVLTSVAPASAANTYLACYVADGRTSATLTTGATCNGVAGPANSVRIKFLANGLTGSRITVTGAGATLSNASDATNLVVASNGLSATIAGADDDDTNNDTFDVMTTTAGTVTINLYDLVAAGSTIYNSTATDTVTITVGTAASSGVYSSAYSSFLMAAGDTSTVSATTDTTPVVAAKSKTTAAATIKVVYKDSLDAALTSKTLTASVSGVGAVLTSQGATWSDETTSKPANVFSVSQATGTGGVAFFKVWANGQAGTATINIYNSDLVLLTSKTVTFAGTSAVTHTVTVRKAYIGAGITTGTAGTKTGSVFAVVLKDSAGNKVTGDSITATSSNTAAVSSVSCSESTSLGTYYCSATAGTLGKSTITFTTGTTAAGTKVTSTADVTVVSAKAATFTITADSSVMPGGLVTYTITAKGADGNPIPDGSSVLDYLGESPVISGGALQNYASVANGGLTSNAVNALFAGATFTSGVATDSVQAPFGATTINGYFYLNGVAGVAYSTLLIPALSGTEFSIDTTVGNPSADALDAANEATDAANAATDAANAAAEAADAATAAAQDAQAAVAELATQVAALIAGIKAQITTLTNLVIKIQKKVKA